MSIPLAFTKHGLARSEKACVILHGLFGSSRNWGTISESLAQKLSQPVYAVDMRNHGATFLKNGPKPMSWNLLADDLCSFTDSIEEKELTLIGHSLGGQVIMQSLFIGQQSLESKTKKLVIVDVAPKPLSFIGSHISKLLDQMIELEKMSLRTRKDAVELMKKIESSDAVIQFLLSNGGIDKESNTFKFNLPLTLLRDGMINLQSSYDSIPKYGTISIPTLFIKGGKSDFIKDPSDFKVISQKFPNSQIHSIVNAGHWPHYDHPNDVINVISKFFL